MKVELKDATKRFGKETVFENQSLNILSGSLVAVLGDNGQGKTTLLDCLYGILELEEGALLWDGQFYDRHDTELRKRAFYMPDIPPVTGQLDGLTQIGQWFKMWGINDESAVDNTLSLLERFGVIEQAGKQLASLSRGQVYKVALSGFLSLKTDLWIIDEPFASGMDTKGLEVFKNCCQEAISQGVTVIYTTQLEELAQSFSTMICRVEGLSISQELKS